MPAQPLQGGQLTGNAGSLAQHGAPQDVVVLLHQPLQHVHPALHPSMVMQMKYYWAHLVWRCLHQSVVAKDARYEQVQVTAFSSVSLNASLPQQQASGSFAACPWLALNTQTR